MEIPATASVQTISFNDDSNVENLAHSDWTRLKSGAGVALAAVNAFEKTTA
ncbi:MAG: hypothetical protein GY737_10800 [Desulfobacteraceae bacterium]|nr:hypothetical protein [Desulfobacteraceae bacterium]